MYVSRSPLLTVRADYGHLSDMLALDQISFYPIKNKGKENAESLEKTERERVAWTYCYLFDRQIAIRTGEKPNELSPFEVQG